MKMEQLASMNPIPVDVAKWYVVNDESLYLPKSRNQAGTGTGSAEERDGHHHPNENVQFHGSRGALKGGPASSQGRPSQLPTHAELHGMVSGGLASAIRHKAPAEDRHHGPEDTAVDSIWHDLTINQVWNMGRGSPTV